MASARKVSIGFEGGQMLVARVSEEELAKLRTALADGGWHDVAADDGALLVNAGKIVYITTDTSDHHVGFGAA